MDRLKGYSEIEVPLSTIALDSQWSDEDYYLNDIVEEFKLPLMAKVCSQTAGSDLEKKIDLSSAFMVYSRRRRTKVVAQILYFDEEQKVWVPDGPNLEIPKDYTGWFEKVRGSENRIQNINMPCNTIEKIVRCKCRKFLVRSPIVGHRYSESDNGIELLEEVNIYIGEILRCDDVVEREWKVVNQNSDAEETSSKPMTQFLKCLDPQKNKLCISLGHPGKFSPIYEQRKADENPSNCVYQLGDLLTDETNFPMPIRLAFGWMPKLPLIPRVFQGVMQFIAVIRPESLVLCSLVDNALPLLEIPINIDVKIKIDQSNTKTLDNRKYKSALKRCYNCVYPFLTSIKIMDVKYKSRDISQQNPSAATKSSKYGRMTSPMDMMRFNPLDVFPAITRPEDISDTWRLSFRDPESTSTDGQGHVTGDGAGVTSRAESVPNDTGNNRNRHDMWDMRDRKMRAREADC